MWSKLLNPQDVVDEESMYNVEIEMPKGSAKSLETINIYAMSIDNKNVSHKILSLIESIQDEINRTGRKFLKQ